MNVKRMELQDQALAMGITPDFISKLVDEFYARIRAHTELSVIFDTEIKEEAWPAHLNTMKQFWSSIALYSGAYSGKPVPAHQKLHDVTPEHFGQWLALFDGTLADLSPNHAAHQYLMERADRIAQSFQLAMYGLESLPKKEPVS